MSLNYGMLSKATTDAIMSKFPTKDSSHSTESKDSEERPAKKAKVEDKDLRVALAAKKEEIKKLGEGFDMLDGCVCQVPSLFPKNGHSKTRTSFVDLCLLTRVSLLFDRHLYGIGRVFDC
jgi:hypothetical protein